MSRASSSIRGSFRILAALLAAVVGCTREPVTRGGDNLVLITLCGARADVVDEAIASGAAPALAGLRARAAASGIATTVASVASECSLGHATLMTVVPSVSFGIGASESGGLEDACAKDGYDIAAFVSRSELWRNRRPFERSRFDLPPIEWVSTEMFGPNAASLELRRESDMTAAAALAWLARATTPFFLWIQFNALAIELAEAPGELREVAKLRLVAIDAAVAAILQELARGSRDRRTWIALASDHGEAFAEQDDGQRWFGHRRLLPAVTQVPLWIVGPQSRTEADADAPRSLDEVGELLARRLGLSTRRDPALAGMHADEAAANDRHLRKKSDEAPPLSFLAEQGRVPLLDRAARAALPELRERLPKATGLEQIRLAELYLGALHALEAPTDAEQAEQDAARKQWLETVAFAGDSPRPLAMTLYARPDPRNDTPLERRQLAAKNARSVFPWYFPAVRVFASLEQMALRSQEAVAALEKFGNEAPLTPEARAQFGELLAATRRNLAPQLPIARPPR